MKTTTPIMTRLLLVLTLLSLGIGRADAVVKLDQTCVVSLLNRTVQVDANGSWAMPNVPSTMGRIKARATCLQDGQTISGESDYFNVVPNGIVTVGAIKFESIEPLPTAVAFSDPNPSTLTKLTDTLQLTVIATYPDGSKKDVSAAATGINYSSTNPEIAAVSDAGLVSAKAAGTVIISARKDGAIAVKQVTIDTQGDADGDGMPDAYEKRHGLNPKDPIDAEEDPDRDGLSNLDEYKAGTDPNKADTDGDGIADGDEIQGTKGFKTNPLLGDTDGDGLGDGVEILVSSDPLDKNDAKYADALVSIASVPASVHLTYNAVYNESTQQLKVVATLIDGSQIDMTAKSWGTDYVSSNLDIVSFGVTDGLLYAGQPGNATVTISNHGVKATVPVVVEGFTPKALSYIEIPGYANNVDVAGDYAYVAAGSSGLQVVNVADRTKPSIVGSLDTAGTSVDVRIVGDVAYLADGDAGLQIIDINDPAHPKLLATYDTAGFAQDLKIDGQYAYIADGDNGLEIADVGNPAKPVSAGHVGNLGLVRGVDVSGDTVVIVNESALRVIDVSDRLNPVAKSKINMGDTRDVVTDGDYAYVAAFNTGYKVVRISDPAQPAIVSEAAPFYPRNVALTDGLAFFADVLFVNAVPYVNIQDPTQAVFQGTVDFTQFDDYNGTGIALDGSYVYLTGSNDAFSDYQADGGSRLYIGQYRELVDNQGVAPTVAITAPQAGVGVIAGTKVTMSVNATDDVAVAGVSFLVNGAVVYTDTTRPYQTTLTIPATGTSVTLGATAVDLGSNTGTAPSLTLSVQPDADKDGLGDDDETTLFKTDPKKADSDGDTLSDGDEALTYKTNPLKKDSDADGIDDNKEIANGTDPLNPDVTPPTVAAIDPAKDAKDVQENSPVVVTFGEALQPKSVKPDSIVVTKDGVAVAGKVNLANNGTQLIFMVDGLFDHVTQFDVKVQGVRDMAGNPIAAAFTSAFTTGNYVNPEHPQVTDSNPVGDETGVPPNAVVSAIMNHAIDPKTVTENSFYVQDNTTYQNIPGAVSVGADGRTVSFVPDTALPVGRNLTVVLTDAIKDLYNNTLYYYSSSFTTAFARDGLAPAIERIGVADGQTGVPTNAVLNIRFNEPISSLSLDQITLDQAGEAVPVKRTLSDDHKVVTLKPVSPLSASTAYTLTVDGAQDLSGNPLPSAATRGFTTAADADTQAPSVARWTPFSNATGVPLNAKLQVKFSEAVDPTTITGDSVYLYDTELGQRVAAPVELGADGTTVTLTPKANLQPYRQYQITVSCGYYYYCGYYGYNYAYVTDLAGNQVYYYTYSYFTTGAAADTAAPTVALQSVPDQATGVPLNPRLNYRLDQAASDLCPGLLELSDAQGTAVAGNLSVSQDRLTVSFRPDAALTGNTAYTAKLSGLCDLAGNPLATVTQTFTTADTAATDTTNPGVTITPANAATGVPVGAVISLKFNEPVDPTTLDSGIGVTISGFNGQVAGTVSLDGDTATFTPLSPFPANATIYVSTYGATDLAGNPAYACGWWGSCYFTTAAEGADTTVPTVVSMTPQDGSLDVGKATPIVLTFSESLDYNTLNGNNFALYANGALISPSVSHSGDNRTVTLTASVPAGSLISVVATGDIKDLSGNRLVDFAATYATAADRDAARPKVISQMPGSGATGVPANADVTLYTDQALNPATVDNTSVHVSQDGVLVAGQLRLSANNRAVEFLPGQPLRKGGLIQVFLDSTVEDTDGNPLNAYQGSFTLAEDPATQDPEVLALLPSYYTPVATIPVNPVIEIQASEALDPATVTTDNVTLNDNQGTPVSATVSLAKGGRVVRIVPDQALAANQGYYYSFANLKDAQGKALQGGGSSIYFITNGTADPDRRAPKVAAMSPANGMENVGVNARVYIRFDEAIDPISLLPDDPDAATRYSVQFSQDNTELRYVPYAPYPASSKVTENAPDVTDYAGNALEAHGVSFKTGAEPDTVAPKLVDINPQNNAQGVPVNAVITLRLDKAIDPLTVNESSFHVNSGGGSVPGSRAVSADGRTLSFAPTAAWAVGQSFTVTLDGAQDLTGNPANGCYYNCAFTTAFDADKTAPTLAQASFADGQTGLPTNAVLNLRFSEAVNGQKLAGAVLKRQDDDAVVGLKTGLSDDRKTLSLTPLSLLKANTGYVLTLEGIQDLAGNALAQAETHAFATGAGIDGKAPALSAWSPFDGATQVPVNAKLSIKFGEPLDPTTVTGDSVYLYDIQDSRLEPTSLALSADGMTATLAPKANLKANRQYRLVVSCDHYYYCGYYGGTYRYVTDYAGNKLYSYNSITFATGDATDATPPKVNLETLADGVTGVPLNPRLNYRFDQVVSDLCQGRLELSGPDGKTVAGTFSVGGDRMSVSFTPKQPLAANTPYTAKLGGLCDLAGNALAALTTGFTTGAASDTTGPGIAITPAYGASDIPVGTAISLAFDEPIDPTTVDSGITVTASVANSSTQVAGTMSLDGDTVTFTPVAPLPPNATVYVYANGVTDLSGNTGYINHHFTTVAVSGDATAPKLTSVTPQNGALDIGPNLPIVLSFSESLDPNTLNNAFWIYADGGLIRPSVGRSGDNRTVTLSAALPANALISVAVTGGVKDLSGNKLADFVSTYSTAPSRDTNQPRIVSQVPGNGAAGVPVAAAPLTLYADRPLNPATVTAASVHAAQDGVLVQGQLKLAANNRAIEFTPAQPWKRGAQVQVFVDSTVQDGDGNALYNYQAAFTTEADTSAADPVVVAAQPSYSTPITDIPVNPAILVQANKALDPATVTTDNVTLTNGNGDKLPVTVGLIKGGKVVRIVPDQALAAGEYFTYTLSNVKDTQGKPLGSGLYSNALTPSLSPDPDERGPKVLGVSPADGKTNVAVNAHLHIRFDEPIAPISLLPDNPDTAPRYSVQFSADNRELSLTPYAPYAASSKVTENLPAVADYAGNAPTAQNVGFNTAAEPETQNPGVVDINPYDGATKVPVNTAVTVTLGEAIDPLTVGESSFYVQDADNGQAIGGSRSVSADGLTLSFVPDAPFAGSKQFNIYLSNVLDLTGNPVNGCYYYGCYSSSYTTTQDADNTAPAVDQANVADGQTGVPTNVILNLRFNEPIDGRSLGGIGLKRESDGQAVTFKTNFGSDHQTLTLTTVPLLKPNTAHTLALEGVKDLAGNTLATDTRTFTTGPGLDGEAPQVTSHTPDANAVDVAVDTQIKLDFNERIDPITLSGNGFSLRDTTNGNTVPAALSLSADGKTATLKPGAALEAGRQYAVYVSYYATVKDLAGNAMSYGIFYFTTAAAP